MPAIVRTPDHSSAEDGITAGVAADAASAPPACVRRRPAQRRGDRRHERRESAGRRRRRAQHGGRGCRAGPVAARRPANIAASRRFRLRAPQA